MENVAVNQVEYISFSHEEEIIHQLLLNASSLKRNGLFYGKLGIAIVFFEYGRCRNNQVYTDFGIELQNSLPKKIDDRTAVDFAAGLCGFGWGIEYLMQNQFIDIENNDICSAIDKKVMAMDIRRMSDLSLETGLEGFLHYVMIRLIGAGKRNERVPFDNIYLQDFRRKLHSLPDEMFSIGLRNLKQLFFSFLHTDIPYYKPNIYSFTKEIEYKNKAEILTAKLGLTDGLAGKLIRIIVDSEKQKTFHHEKYLYHRRICQFQNKRHRYIPA